MNLRPYQQEARRANLQAREEGLRRVLSVLPTGTGKSLVAASVVEGVRQGDDRPALVLAQKDELLTQLQQACETVMPGVWCDREQAEKRADERCQIVFGSVPTLAREGSSRLSWLAERGASVVICDEVHHFASDGGRRVVERFGGFDGRSFFAGFTATPHRLDKRELFGDGAEALFQRQVFDYPLVRAIRDGYLCPIRGMRVVTETDISGVATRGGDFVPAQLALAVDVETRTRKAFEHWREVAGDRKTLISCVNVEHAKHAARIWGEACRSEWVVGDMEQENRRDVIRRFRSGEIQVATNVGVLAEGFDCPDISCVVLLAPTQSWVRYAQAVGRGTRLAPGKTDLLVIDVVDSTTKHDLCALPILVGLPNKLDLEGHTVEEALDEWEAAEAEGKLRRDKPPVSFSRIKTTLVEVDLLKEAMIPPEVERAGSIFGWLYAGVDGYILPGGFYSREQKPRVARVERDALGAWHCDIHIGMGHLVHRVAVGEDEFPDFGRCDEVVKYYWKDCWRLLLRENRWHADAVTDKQRKVLHRYGITDDEIAGMSKGDAHKIIGRHMVSGVPHRAGGGRRR